MENKPSQQQPAEGENYMNREPLPDDNVKTYDATISPTEEELETLANDYAEYHYSEPELKHFYSIAYAAYMACGRKLRKRYTRQGGEDWEALYISEHLNLLAAKGRIAELEKQLREFDNSLKEANKNRG